MWELNYCIRCVCTQREPATDKRYINLNTIFNDDGNIKKQIELTKGFSKFFQYS